MEIKFLNVDLVIDSYENLQPLVNELAGNVSVMFNGEWENNLNRLSLAIKYSYEKTADEIVLEFCYLIEKFSSESNLIWNRCQKREFDVGFESGSSLTSYETEIQAETIQRVAKLGGSILITIYPST